MACVMSFNPLKLFVDQHMQDMNSMDVVLSYSQFIYGTGMTIHAYSSSFFF